MFFLFKKIIISKINKFIRIFLIFLLFAWLLLILLNDHKFRDNTNYFNLDRYETFVYDNIKEALLKSRCSNMWNNQREFINGIIRKFKPKTILELGVHLGGVQLLC